MAVLRERANLTPGIDRETHDRTHYAAGNARNITGFLPGSAACYQLQRLIK